MATINVVNTTLSGQTGTGTFVGNTAPTLSGTISDTIKLTSTSGILDSNGNILLGFTTVASAVNYLAISNNPTTGAPILKSLGSDANVSIDFLAQGTGGFVFTSQAPTTPVAFFNGTSSQHKTSFVFSNTSANRTVTFPDADGTVSFSTIATQADQEAGSSITAATTPGRQQYHPSAAKFWLEGNFSGTINLSYNVTSITDTGTGVVDITIATDFSSGVFAAFATAISDSYRMAQIALTNYAAGTCRVLVFDILAAAADANGFSAIGFGDQ